MVFFLQYHLQERGHEAESIIHKLEYDEKMSCLWRFLQGLEHFSVEIPSLSTRTKWQNKLFLFVFFLETLSRISPNVIKPMR